MKIPTSYTVFLKEVFQKKFVKDSAWMLLSQSVVAICGFTMNAMITRYYGLGQFGNFSLALKIYMISSVFTSLGVGISGIRHSAQLSDDRILLGKSMSAAIILVASVSVVLTGVLFYLSPLISSFFDEFTLTGLLRVFFSALPFLSLNKLLVLIINGQRDLKAVSIIQASRWVVLILFFLGFLFIPGTSIEYSIIAFPITEVLLLAGAWIYIKRFFNFSFRIEKNWIKKHLFFGTKTMFSSLITDITSHLDVLIGGYFYSSRQMGIYNFAADIAKNLIVVADIFSANINPIISRLYSDGKLKELNEYIKKLRNITYLSYIPLLIGAMFIYYLLIKFFFIQLEASFIPFVIISAGTFIISGFKPFAGILELTGHPGAKLGLSIIHLFISFSLILVFSYSGGINEIAIALMWSYIAYIITLSVFSYKILGLRLI